MYNKAIYAGSFDPITNGHIDIIRRAEKLFDKLIIAVIRNPEKDPVFTIEERIELITELFKSSNKIEVEGFEGLTAEFAKKKDSFTLIRGLRAVSDFDYEFQMSQINRALDPRIESVCLMTDAKYLYLSSSLIRQLASYGANISEFVPKSVETALKAKGHLK